MESYVPLLRPSRIQAVDQSVNLSSSCEQLRNCTYVVCVATVIVNEHAERPKVNFILIAVSVTSIAFVQYVQIACR